MTEQIIAKHEGEEIHVKVTFMKFFILQNNIRAATGKGMNGTRAPGPMLKGVPKSVIIPCKGAILYKKKTTK